MSGKSAYALSMRPAPGPESFISPRSSVSNVTALVAPEMPCRGCSAGTGAAATRPVTEQADLALPLTDPHRLHHPARGLGYSLSEVEQIVTGNCGPSETDNSDAPKGASSNDEA